MNTKKFLLILATGMSLGSNLYAYNFITTAKNVIEWMAPNTSAGRLWKRGAALELSAVGEAGLDAYVTFARDMCTPSLYYDALDALVYLQDPRILAYYKPAVAGTALLTALTLFGGPRLMRALHLLGSNESDPVIQETHTGFGAQLLSCFKHLTKIAVVAAIAVPLFFEADLSKLKNYVLR